MYVLVNVSACKINYLCMSVLVCACVHVRVCVWVCVCVYVCVWVHIFSQYTYKPSLGLHYVFDLLKCDYRANIYGAIISSGPISVRPICVIG